MEFIEINGLRKVYGKHGVLKAIDLSVDRHQVVSLIGASGSAKSTLLRCIKALETIDGGQIALDGDVVSGPGVDQNRLRRKVGMVFQSFNLFPHLSVEETSWPAPCASSATADPRDEDHPAPGVMAGHPPSHRGSRRVIAANRHLRQTHPPCAPIGPPVAVELTGTNEDPRKARHPQPVTPSPSPPARHPQPVTQGWVAMPIVNLPSSSFVEAATSPDTAIDLIPIVSATFTQVVMTEVPRNLATPAQVLRERPRCRACDPKAPWFSGRRILSPSGGAAGNPAGSPVMRLTGFKRISGPVRRAFGRAGRSWGGASWGGARLGAGRRTGQGGPGGLGQGGPGRSARGKCRGRAPGRARRAGRRAGRVDWGKVGRDGAQGAGAGTGRRAAREGQGAGVQGARRAGCRGQGARGQGARGWSPTGAGPGCRAVPKPSRRRTPGRSRFGEALARNPPPLVTSCPDARP